MLPALALRLGPLLLAAGAAVAQEPGAAPERLALEPARVGGVRALRGTLEVAEDPAEPDGWRIPLNVVVLPATGPDPRPDPIVWLAGGPGQAATSLAAGLAASGLRRDRDVLLVDQRGTGGSNRLDCAVAGDDGDLQGTLEPLFDPERFRACRAALADRADLELYTTPIAMDDLDAVCAALGYERVNLVGGSYGTRAALVFLRRHPERVRAVVLKGVAPIAFRNPLHHARSAQEALDGLLAACAADARCAAAYPRLAAELDAVLARLARAPARVVLPHPVTGEPTELSLTRAAFAEALRVLLYTTATARGVPLAVHAAHGGDYRPFVRAALARNRALRDTLALGMLLCVTCAEDVARIDPDEVAAATAGTFLGDARVRAQMAVCAGWPRGRVPADYGAPVRGDAPVLLISGTLDPVTPPRWGAEAARHLANARHLVVPAFHDPGGPCVEAIVARFLERPVLEELDTSCLESLRLPPFELPAGAR